MRNILLLAALLIGCCGEMIAQKRAVDGGDLRSWPNLGGCVLSNDGRYLSYDVAFRGGRVQRVVMAADGSQRWPFVPMGDGAFTSDSRRFVMLLPGDSLCSVALETRKIEYTPGVRDFSIPEGRGHWWAYEDTTDRLFVLDQQTGLMNRYSDVQAEMWAPGGEAMVLQKKDSLQWLELGSGKLTTFWRGGPVEKLVFDRSGRIVGFYAAGGIWYSKMGEDAAKELVGGNGVGIEPGYGLAKGTLQFSTNGKRLFFGVKKVPKGTTQETNPGDVQVWSYTDEFVEPQLEQITKTATGRSFQAEVFLDTAKVIRLEGDGDNFYREGRFNDGGGDDYLLVVPLVNMSEAYRMEKERPDIFLVNTANGERMRIGQHIWSRAFEFSPGGKYLYWYDFEKQGFVVYDIQRQEQRTVSTGVRVGMEKDDWDIGSPKLPYGIAGWLEGDEGMLVYDRYDIWNIDPKGRRAPVNVTNGYGRRTTIRLRIVSYDGEGSVEKKAFSGDADVTLAGYNETNIDNGFFKKRLDVTGDPKRLTMERAFFYFPNPSFDFAPSYVVEKAKSAPVYLVKRMTAQDCPNLQITRDFVHFDPLTDLEPQKRVNWLTDTLVHWRTFDGRPGLGILYRPEDFDATKKYPVIFYIYEVLSYHLNDFIAPDFSAGPINISWFVSHGYLVFCPDIHYRLGRAGEDAYNYVVSAASMMTKKPWVDAHHMGVQGHSWGGYEVNYLITRTNIFAAAASAAGPADWLSDYGSLAFFNNDLHQYLETGQPRLGTSLWSHPEVFLRNSPVMGADKVAMPLLMMHNKGDLQVPWSQGVEFFTDLRRLGKRVWMLQYDKGTHGLLNDRDSEDYTKRLQAFFDHYLKGRPAPGWMKP